MRNDLHRIRRHPQEDSGEVFGVGLVWPSSHRTLVERTQSGTVRLVMGVHPDSFRWNLRPGEQFLAPEAVHVYSSTGVGGMSRQMHSLIRHRVLPAAGTTKWTFDAPRPVLVNSWEAMYFNCSEQAILESLVEPAADLGCIDLIVLDDGWFKNRVDDRRALGDWVTDSGKFPSGLQSLALRIQQRGMQFGIWMEPEMISVDSDLYRFHPDWCLQVPGRRKTESRNQLVLDLSRLDVQQFIVESVSRVLRESSASYLKVHSQQVII
jgi:alpha-galactosidase